MQAENYWFLINLILSLIGIFIAVASVLVVRRMVGKKSREEERGSLDRIAGSAAPGLRERAVRDAA